MITLACAALACRSAPYVWVHERMPEPKALNNLTIVGVGDLISVSVYGDDTLATRGRVLPDGTLTMPVLGPVPAAGKNSQELARDLELRLTKYVTVPKVTVLIEESQISLAVLGEVKQPGVVQLVTPANVLQAIAKAGGLTDFASSSGIYVLRTDHGKTQRIRFDYDALTEGETMATSFQLRTGDVLIVE